MAELNSALGDLTDRAASTKFDGISSELKGAIAQVDSSAGDGVAHDTVGIDDLVINAVISGASGDTSERQLDSFVITFDRPVDPVMEAADTGGGDYFVFQTSEPTTAMETYYNIKMEDALISSWSSSGASETGYNDGVVDAADYVVWRKTDTVDTDLSLSAAVDTGVPVSMPEYALLLL